MLLPLISLDLETTGLEPAVHAPWEIAWVTAIHDTDAETLRVVRSRSFMLQLDQTVQLDPVALVISKFWDRYAAPDSPDRLPWWAVQLQLLADLDRLRSHIVDRITLDSSMPSPTVPATHLIGAVPQFDHRMLERWFGWAHRHWHHHLIDVETLAAGRLGLTYPIDTDHLTRQLLPADYDSSHKHEAAADCTWNLDIYSAVYSLQIIADES